jgi:hypothetical protein
MLAQGGQYVAIIDTGSSQIAIPPQLFNSLKDQWMRTIPKLDCSGHEIFCFVDQACSDVEKKLQPVGFQLSGMVYEIPASQYLFASNPSKCFLKIHKNNLPDQNSNLFLMGGLFLKHFYSVFDFDNDLIGLGIDVNFQDSRV